MEDWVSIANIEALAERQKTLIHWEGVEIAIFRVGEEWLAVDNSCPHQGGPLVKGEVEGEIVTCPWHGWRYDLRSGCPVSTPGLKTYPLRIVGGQLQLGIDRVKSGTPALIVESPLQPLLSSLDDAKTLSHMTGLLSEGLQAHVPHNRIGVAMLDGKTQRLVQVATHSDREIVLGNGFAASIQGSSLQRLLTDGTVRIIDDLWEILKTRPSAWTRMLVEEGMRSNLTLPLQIQGTPVGVLFFSSEAQAGFQPEHVGLLEQIADRLAILMEKGHWVTDLAQSNERYKILFEMLHEGVFTCASPDVPFATLHPNLASWLMEDVTQLKRRTLRSLLAPDAVARCLHEIEQLHSDGGSRAFETDLMRKDGAKLPVELRLTRIIQQGAPFLMGFVHNLSEVKALNARLQDRQTLDQLTGKSPKMLKLYELVKKVAPLQTTVLITGESGTGKELFARAIHKRSARAERPMVVVNCGALNDNLLESEWFGHEKGAFTGAVRERQGRFALADGGTIFLDEIGELAPSTQVKLLRVLQEGEYEPVGSSQTRRTDVRIIAATNRDLKVAVATGEFREDLYYRLNIVQLELPPLRERKDDIPLLIATFINKFNASTQKAIQRVSEEALIKLLGYQYPGNVRQLENVMEHAFVLCQQAIIDVQHLPPEVTMLQNDLVEQALRANDPLAALEQNLIQRVIELHGGNQQLAAQRLGISRTTLWRKLKKNVQ